MRRLVFYFNFVRVFFAASFLFRADVYINNSVLRGHYFTLRSVLFL